MDRETLVYATALYKHKHRSKIVFPPDSKLWHDGIITEHAFWGRIARDIFWLLSNLLSFMLHRGKRQWLRRAKEGCLTGWTTHCSKGTTTRSLIYCPALLQPQTSSLNDLSSHHVLHTELSSSSWRRGVQRMQYQQTMLSLVICAWWKYAFD